jgi:hypothetical protein
MSAGEYGGFVYKNGARCQKHDYTSVDKFHEDMKLFRDLSGGEKPNWGVLLGAGHIQLAFNKLTPQIYVDGELLPMTIKPTTKSLLHVLIEDYEIKVVIKNRVRSILDARLREPDGTVWSAIYGFHYGVMFGSTPPETYL